MRLKILSNDILRTTLLLLFSVVISNSEAQDSTRIKLSEMIYNTTTKIECYKYEKEAGKLIKVKSTGTGFFFNLMLDNDTVLAIITNKHVVENRETTVFKFNRSVNAAPKYGDTVIVNIKNSSKLWVLHPTEDLALMPILPFVSSMIDRSKAPFIKAYTEDLIPTLQEEKEMDALIDVVMIGYPKGFSDSINNVPVFRKGITATPFFLNYNNTPKFLVDIPIFSGSSGSPVLYYSTGDLGGGMVKVAPHLKMLGIATDSRNYEAIGYGMVDKSNLKIKTVTSLPLNIAYAIKSRLVLDFKATLRKIFASKEYIELYDKSFY
jgi:hypothetical protein